MYQELLEAERGKVSDFWMLILLVAAIFILEPLAVLLNSVSNIAGVLSQLVVFLALVAFFIIFYKKRLRSFRITFFTDNTERFGELMEVPEGFSEYEHGSLLVESLVGLTGSYIALVHKNEIKRFYELGKESDEHISPAYRLNAVFDKKKPVHALIFEQENKCYKLLFQPSQKIVLQLNEYLNNTNND